MVDETIEIRELESDQVSLIGEIDRSERIEAEYYIKQGSLMERWASMTDIPAWDAVGTGPHSVAAAIAFCRPLISRGAVLLGAFEAGQVLGVAVVEGSFEPARAWLAFLHVDLAARRRGVASALWDAAIEVGAGAGATSIYVSSAPTESAVRFYLSRGCDLAAPVHPALYTNEPDDIHLTCSIG